ncbi:hypothetical protein N9854_03570 [Amylibacter sp.]|nr:hypothetical protein [Amylibacter sp.]
MRILVFFFSFFLVSFHCLADESNNKEWSILGGWGDKIFSIFGNAIENQNKREQFILNELSKSDGKLTIDEVQKLEKHRLEMTVKENEEALKMLNKFYDPETGMMSGFHKLGNKIYDEAKIERDIQKEILDLRIDEIISAHNIENLQVTKLKLRLVRWSPINHSTIDKNMTDYYDKLVEKIIGELEN